MLRKIESIILDQKDQQISAYSSDFEKLKIYYQRQYKLLQTFEKNPEKRKEYSRALRHYIEDIDVILNHL